MPVCIYTTIFGQYVPCNRSPHRDAIAYCVTDDPAWPPMVVHATEAHSQERYAPSTSRSITKCSLCGMTCCDNMTRRSTLMAP